MGVDGREMGVGIELVVLVVATVLILLLPSVDTDNLDIGRRLVGAPGCDMALGARLPLEGDGDADVEAADIRPRYAEGAIGLDVRRRSFSLSLTGDGESSMISTHPDESLAGVLLFSLSESILCLRGLNVLVLSGDLFGRNDEDDVLEVIGEDIPEGPAFGVCGAFPLIRLVTLAMRNRGTRV